MHSIGQLLNLLGDNFRGLWRSREILPDESYSLGWSVTFKYKNDYCETPYFDTPVKALKYAVNKLFTEAKKKAGFK